MRFAWIESSSTENASPAYAAATGNAQSPLTLLIESVQETEAEASTASRPSRARSILRERIHCDYEPAPSEIELVKSAAKRVSVGSPVPQDLRARAISGPLPFLTSPLRVPRAMPDFDRELETVTENTLSSASKVRDFLEALKKKVRREGEPWASGRPVSAALIGSNGRTLAATWNTNAPIRNRHAEWNLCEILLRAGERIPKDAVLWVSLKPCRMCAARIWECAEDPARLDVRYLEDDPGTAARGTLLEIASPARVRYLGLNSPLFRIPTQRQVLFDSSGAQHER